jgi:hypothetical protein
VEYLFSLFFQNHRVVGKMEYSVELDNLAPAGVLLDFILGFFLDFLKKDFLSVSSPGADFAHYPVVFYLCCAMCEIAALRVPTMTLAVPRCTARA